MNLYRYNSYLKKISFGEIDLQKAFNELDKVLSRGGEIFNNDNTAIPATTFILSRNNIDWLEVSCHSLEEVHFSSERLIYNINWCKKIFADKGIQFRASSEKSKEVIANYFTLNREEFEIKYKIGYTNRESLFYIKLPD